MHDTFVDCFEGKDRVFPGAWVGSGAFLFHGWGLTNDGVVRLVCAADDKVVSSPLFRTSLQRP